MFARAVGREPNDSQVRRALTLLERDGYADQPNAGGWKLSQPAKTPEDGWMDTGESDIEPGSTQEGVE